MKSFMEVSINITYTISVNIFIVGIKKFTQHIMIFKMIYINCASTKLSQMGSSIWPIRNVWSAYMSMLGLIAPAIGTLFN